MSVENLILIGGLLLLVSVLAGKFADRVGVPSLLLFLAVGMLAGSEGLGGIEFDAPHQAQALGTVALMIILFSGGLDTRWQAVRPVLRPGLLMSTVGVVLTALILGAFAKFMLANYSSFDVGPAGITWTEALLLAAIVSSTDAAALFEGNGFLAVYIAGVIIGNRINRGREQVEKFHEGLSWLMQIAMFVMLGLLAFPSQLLAVAPVSITLALFLMLVARPLSVLVCYLPFGPRKNELAYVSWVGLRGSVPIVLATFPATYGLAYADQIFNVIFFVVLTSVLIQGMTLIPAARLLGVIEK